MTEKLFDFRKAAQEEVRKAVAEILPGCADCISRQAAIETVRKAQSIGQAHRMLLQLPPAQPGCEDTVYRKAIQMLLAYFVPEERYAEAVDGLRRLPPAQPEQPEWAQAVERWYNKALCNPCIHKPLAWALYQVWKEYDNEG